MARNPIASRQIGTPPRMAERMVAILVEPGHRQVLLGDLEEEYRTLWATSPKVARTWYWRQSICSWLPLLGARWRNYQRQTSAVMWMAMVAAVVAIFAWEHRIAVTGAWNLASALEPGHLGLARTLYVALKLMGLALVGVAFWVSFHKKMGANVRAMGTRLWPLGLCILLPLGRDVFTAAETDLFVLRLMLLALAIPAWLLGMVVAKNLVADNA